MNTFYSNTDNAILVRKLLKEITKRVSYLNCGESVKIYSKGNLNGDKNSYGLYFGIIDNSVDIEQIYYIYTEYKNIYETENIIFIWMDMR